MESMPVRRLFLSCLKPVFRSEAKCKASDMKMNFYSHVNKTHFHEKGFALSLVLKVRVLGTWKWPNMFIKIVRLQELMG